jgi:hypothetical protein
MSQQLVIPEFVATLKALTREGFSQFFFCW